MTVSDRSFSSKTVSLALLLALSGLSGPVWGQSRRPMPLDDVGPDRLAPLDPGEGMPTRPPVGDPPSDPPSDPPGDPSTDPPSDPCEFQRTKNWSKTIGGSKLSVDLRAAASLDVSGSANRASADGRFRGSAKVFGKSFEVVTAEARGRTNNDGAEAGVLFKLGGKTLLDKSVQAQAIDRSFAREYTKTLPEKSKTFWLGPVPVRLAVAANATAGFGFRAELRGITARLTGTNDDTIAYAHAEGEASAGIGGTINLYFAKIEASAGVQATLRLLDGKLRFLVEYADCQLRAYSRLQMTAVRLLVKLYAQAKGYRRKFIVFGSWKLIFDKSWDTTIVNKSWGNVDTTLFSF